MKKLTVMLLIAAMVLGVSACGNSANKENTATESQMSTQENAGSRRSGCKD